jgi:hypothetical protein
MRSLRWRLTITHLLVSLLAVALVALLTPPLFLRTYSASELKRWQTITGGLARAAEPLLREGADSPYLRRLVRNSSEVLAAEVTIIGADGKVVISSNSGRAVGQPLPRAPASPERLANMRRRSPAGAS